MLNSDKTPTTSRKGNRRYLAFSIQHSAFMRGFTLLEMMISSGIFAVVIIMAVGVMLSLSQAQVKATNIQNTQDNLRFTLESMTKELRTGTNYVVGSCGAVGCTEITFVRQDGISAGYCLSSGAIRRFLPPGVCSGGSVVTSSAVAIDKLYFSVIGQAAGPSDGQPRITVVIEARSVNPTLQFETNSQLETTVTQRVRDT